MAKKKAAPAEAKPHEIDGIPTVVGLAAKSRDLAYPVPGGYHLTAAGHRELQDALAARARANIEKGTWRGVTGEHPAAPRQPGL